MIKYIDLESSLQSSPNECRVFGGKKVDWLSDMLSLYYNNYTTIYYSAVASNLLRSAISRAILSDQPELVL